MEKEGACCLEVTAAGPFVGYHKLNFLAMYLALPQGNFDYYIQLKNVPVKYFVLFQFTGMYMKIRT